MTSVSQKTDIIKAALTIPPVYDHYYREWHSQLSPNDKAFLRERINHIKQLVPKDWDSMKRSEIFGLIDKFDVYAFFSSVSESHYEGKILEMRRAVRRNIL